MARGKKKTCYEEKWQCKLRKKARNSGEHYESRKGKTVGAKKKKKPNWDATCCMRCH